MSDQGYPIFCMPCGVEDFGELNITIVIGPVTLELSLADAIRVRDELDKLLRDSDLLEQARPPAPEDLPPESPSA